MTDIIQRLEQDHLNISKLLALLEKQTEHFARGEYTDYQIITDIMNYIVNYPDVYHHPHEEIIFDALKSKDKSTASLIDEITSEHAAMSAESAAILDEMIEIQGNAIFSREEIVTRLQKFIKNYHEHIRKEETGLFALAREKLGADDWQTVEDEIGGSMAPQFNTVLDKEYQNLYKIILSEDKESQ